jgi:hypothetical protein
MDPDFETNRFISEMLMSDIMPNVKEMVQEKKAQTARNLAITFGFHVPSMPGRNPREHGY